MSTQAMNRAQRRAAKRNERKVKPVFEYGTAENERIARICKNGISIEDLDMAYKKGAEDGQKKATKMCYAGFLLAMHKVYGFGKKRATRLLKAADDAVVYSIDTEEMMDAVYKRFGIVLDFNDNDVEGRVREAT